MDEIVLNKLDDDLIFGIKNFYWQFEDLSPVYETDKDY